MSSTFTASAFCEIQDQVRRTYRHVRTPYSDCGPDFDRANPARNAGKAAARKPYCPIHQSSGPRGSQPQNPHARALNRDRASSSGHWGASRNAARARPATVIQPMDHACAPATNRTFRIHHGNGRAIVKGRDLRIIAVGIGLGHNVQIIASAITQRNLVSGSSPAAEWTLPW